MFHHLRFLPVYTRVGADVFLFNTLRTRSFNKSVDVFLSRHGQELSKNQKKRILQYTVQMSITDAIFCTLRGKGPDKDEMRRGNFVAAVTPVFDDILDLMNLNSEQLLELIREEKLKYPEKLVLLKYLYEGFMCEFNEGDCFHEYFQKTLKAQDYSLRQVEGAPLTQDEILHISADKGGYSTLLYRSVLKNTLKKGEEEAIYTLGTFFQLTDDVFDVYRDHADHHQTLHTNTSDMNEVRAVYEKLIDKIIDQFMELDYKHRNKLNALSIVLLIASSGMLAFEQLCTIQKRTGNKFRINEYSRQELVCDMEKLSNRLKVLNKIYFLTLKLKDK